MPHLDRNQRKRPWVPERKPQEGRINPNDEIYQSYRWRELSKAKRKSSPICEECLRLGVRNAKPSQMTDHIVPINLGGDPWAWDNLQALCNSHHNRKSAKDKKK